MYIDFIWEVKEKIFIENKKTTEAEVSATAICMAASIC